jgi:hypothetical protein
MAKDGEIVVERVPALIHARNMDVLIAWPPSGALPEGDREDNFSADE